MAYHHDYLSTAALTSKIAEHNDDRKLDFTDPSNTHQDWNGLAVDFADSVVSKWGRSCRQHGFTSDAQLGSAAICALTAIQVGFYMKAEKSAQFADGTLVTLTDRDVHPGDEKIQTATMGTRYTAKDGGFVPPDGIPERAVTLGEDLFEQTFHEMRDKTHVTMKELARADKRGFNAFEAKGRALRAEHNQNLNTAIRQGNTKLGLTGLTNHPGIRQYMAQIDWGAASADDIWDDLRAALKILATSETEEGYPETTLLPAIQYNHMTTEQFSLASDTVLRTWIERNIEANKLVMDFGMRGIVKGTPGGLMYTNDVELVRVTMPYWLRMLTPFSVNEKTMRVMIESSYAGCQVPDVDTLLVIDGRSANWEKFAA